MPNFCLFVRPSQADIESNLMDVGSCGYYCWVTGWPRNFSVFDCLLVHIETLIASALHATGVGENGENANF